MALWGKSDKNSSAEENAFVESLLLKTGVADNVVKDIKSLLEKDRDMGWVVKSTGYNDMRRRCIAVFDGGIIFFSNTSSALEAYSEVVSRSKTMFSNPLSFDLKIINSLDLYDSDAGVGLANLDKIRTTKTRSLTIFFDKYGFSPLTSYYQAEKNMIISTDRVRKIMAKLVFNALAKEFPNLKVASETAISDGTNLLCGFFDYEIAPSEWKTWFGGVPELH